MSMFCYQCQETAGGKGCTMRGVCGKTEEVAKASGYSDLHPQGHFRNCSQRKVGRQNPRRDKL